MENKNTILRVNKNKNYTVISNIHIQDKDLSWGAKGLLTYLLSLPDDWKIYLNELTSHTKDGITKTSTLIKELIVAKYIVRKKLRNKGKFAGYEYIVSEIPDVSEINSHLSTAIRKTENGKTVNGKTVNGKSNTTKYLNNKVLKKQITNNNTENINITINSDEIYNLAKEIEKTIDREVNIEVLKSSIKKNNLLLDDIRYYLSNWNKFDGITKNNPIGFLLNLAINKAPLPKRENGFTKPDQAYNFEQRVYDDDYFDSLYENL